MWTKLLTLVLVPLKFRILAGIVIISHGICKLTTVLVTITLAQPDSAMWRFYRELLSAFVALHYAHWPTFTFWFPADAAYSNTKYHYINLNNMLFHLKTKVSGYPWVKIHCQRHMRFAVHITHNFITSFSSIQIHKNSQKNLLHTPSLVRWFVQSCFFKGALSILRFLSRWQNASCENLQTPQDDKTSRNGFGSIVKLWY